MKELWSMHTITSLSTLKVCPQILKRQMLCQKLISKRKSPSWTRGENRFTQSIEEKWSENK